jgi:hypothetical protein
LSILAENPGELVDVSHARRFDVDPRAKAPVGFANVMQERQSGEPRAGDRVQIHQTSGGGQSTTDRRLTEQSGSYSSHIG